MKKRYAKLFSILMLALAMIASVLPASRAGTAEARYNYTVRIYAGAQGTVSGGEYVSYPGLNYGDRVNFNLRDVKLKDDSKYYVKGIRPAGRDNNTVGMTSFPVEGDADYVIAYGLLSDAVMYTIEYVDTAGNELAPSEHYYGNVGDKPVIAFLYIEGYRPNAYNLTRTLSADASENIFRFVYTRVADGDGDDGNGPGSTGGGNGGTPSPQPTGQAPAQPAEQPEGRPNINPGGIPVVPAAENQGGNQDDDNGDENGGEETEIDDGQVPLDDSEELVDLDDNQVPLNNMIQVLNEAHILGIPAWCELLALLLIIAAAAYCIYRFNEKRRNG